MNGNNSDEGGRIRKRQGYKRWEPPVSQAYLTAKFYAYTAILLINYFKMGEFSDCSQSEYSGRNQQSSEDRINWAPPR